MALSSYSRVIGAILLVAGCCTGAGMLGLPVLSAPSGFFPTCILFILCWFFMFCTGILLLEANLAFKEDVSLITMSRKTLGIFGQILTWGLFIFLFYSLNIAYIAGSGSLLVNFLEDVFHLSVEQWVGSLVFSLLFGGLIYLGTHAVDEFNRILMFALIGTYVILIIMGIGQVDPQFWKHSNWKASFLVVPTMIISFGYHNLIPSLKRYLHGDATKLKWTIFIGSLIPLFIYLIWEGMILGLVPPEAFQYSLDNGEMASQTLKNAVGSSWIVTISQFFAFFAIVTSCLAVALSLVDFLSDGLGIKKTRRGKIFLIFLALAPCFLFSFTHPHIFLTALNYAGAFGAVILFGILPALMVWKGRYGKTDSSYTQKAILPGGKGMLLFILFFSVSIVILQICHEWHLIEFHS